MKETCTFSRALHLMRYGGKKMAFVDWLDTYACIIDNEFCIVPSDDIFVVVQAYEIMGSWVEVK